MLQACLNGGRTREEHPAVPVTPAELAADARRAVEAGADELHVHPRAADGRETLEPEAVAAVVVAIRESCPGVPLGLTTGLWTAGDDAERRLRLVASWEELPDYVSANVDEPGLAELCELVARGVLAAARERGHDTRVGLEDTTVLADGSTAHDNAELVAAAGMP